MKHLFLFLRRVLIVFLVGTFISVSTFRGKAIADDTGGAAVTPFINVCTLQRQYPSLNQPDFKNPPFADADYIDPSTDEKVPIILRATQAEFTLEGNGKEQGKKYNGYIYGAEYIGRLIDEEKSSPDNPVYKYEPVKLKPSYTPPVIEVSPSAEVDGKKKDNYLKVNLINDLPVNVQLAGKLPQTKENLESVSQYTNIHYHGFNVSPLLGGDDVLVSVPSNVTPKPGEIPIPPANTQDPYRLIPVPPLGDTTPESTTDISEGNIPGGYYPDYLENQKQEPDQQYTSGPITDYNMGFLIPDIHQSGLFWYHSHAHSLSDNQVRGGLSGAIIIKGNEEYYGQFFKPTPPPPSTFAAPESKAIRLPFRANSLEPEITQQVMTFKDFNDVLGTGAENCFVLNSQVNPKITIKPGEIQLWRIANIGADTYMNIALETLSEPGSKAKIIGAASFEDGTISNTGNNDADGSISGSIKSIIINEENNAVEGSFQVDKTDGSTAITKDITISDATVSDYHEDQGSRPKTVSFTINGNINGQTDQSYERSGKINAHVTGTIGKIPAFTQPYGNSNFYILARDSDVVANPVATNSVLLPPASRVELLVVGGEPGSTYNLVSDLATNLTTKQQQWLNSNLNTSYVLGTVEVQGTDEKTYTYKPFKNGPLYKALKERWPALADYLLNLPGIPVSACAPSDTIGEAFCNSYPFGEDWSINLDYFIRNQQPYKIDEILPEPRVIAKLGTVEDGGFCSRLYQGHDDGSIGEKIFDRLKSFCITPSNAYPNEPLTTEREFVFRAIQRGKHFVVNDKIYDGNRIDKVSHVGDIEEWDLVNPTGFPHVFHIHQLDFVVTKVKLNYDPCENLAEGATCTYNNYVVKNNSCDDEGEGSQNSEGRYLCELEPQGYRDVFNLPSFSTTTVRIPFVNPFITGIFVYHCHILGHEDEGMMQNLKVINPEGFREDQLINLKKWLLEKYRDNQNNLEGLSEEDQQMDFENSEWLYNWRDIDPDTLSKDELSNFKKRLRNLGKK